MGAPVALPEVWVGGTAGKSLASPWAREIDEAPGFGQSFHVGADGSNNDKIQDKRDGIFYQSGFTAPMSAHVPGVRTQGPAGVGNVSRAVPERLESGNDTSWPAAQAGPATARRVLLSSG